jgi:hypothetical protein
MRRFLTVAVLFCSLFGACARSSSDLDRMQPGTQLTVTMKDGSAVHGRLVQVKPDAVVVDPGAGGEWKTLPRNQIASVSTLQLTQAPATSPGAQPAPGTMPRAAATPAEPPGRDVTIPANTLLHVRLDSQVASDSSRAEDPVQASVTRPVVIDGLEAIPAGSTLKGVVTEARRSGKVRGRAAVAFRFETLTVSGDQPHRVRTQLVAHEAKGTQRKDALTIGAPAAGGAILGGILGGKKGALIGGAVGGGAGTAYVLGTPGKEVRLPPGTAVTVKLLEPVTVRVAIDR